MSAFAYVHMFVHEYMCEYINVYDFVHDNLMIIQLTSKNIFSMENIIIKIQS